MMLMRSRSIVVNFVYDSFQFIDLNRNFSVNSEMWSYISKFHFEKNIKVFTSVEKYGEY